MKTRCPNCQTIFRITPEQIKARAGKVRCGHCRATFNALDSLLEGYKEHKERKEKNSADPALAPAPVPASAPSLANMAADTAVTHAEPVEPGKPVPAAFSTNASVDTPAPPKVLRTLRQAPPSSPANEPQMQEAGESEDSSPEMPPVPVTPQESVETALIFPREISEIPDFGKWEAGVMAPPIELSSEKPSRWPFRLTAAGLALALAAQALFHFRSELAVSMPSLRSSLETFSRALGAPLPLPRHNEQVSLETSDLQTDPARGNLLVLNATLRNKAPYGQAYPSLELSLTDRQDTVIARRVFAPQDYLPAKTAANPVFSGNSDVAVRLWIEAVDMAAAGYRLFVFYP
ncbi:membrane protein [Betaproteobacteria bacterium]|nr:membrane protein [Betaproteobacteria bacterium]